MTSLYTDYLPQHEYQALALSPSGRLVAWTDRSGTNINIYVHDRTTKTTTQRTHFTDRSARQLVWTPDEAALLFIGDENGNEEFRLYALDLADDSIRCVLPESYRRVMVTGSAFSPDGKQLFFTAPHADPRRNDPYLLDLGTGDIRALAPGDAMAAPSHWSADGRTVFGVQVRGNTDHQPLRWDVATGEVADYPAYPAGELTRAFGTNAHGQLLCGTTHGREVAGIAAATAQADHVTWLLTSTWDISAHLSELVGDEVFVVVNENGYHRTALISATCPTEESDLQFFEGLTDGTIEVVAACAEAKLVACIVSSPTSPSNIVVLDLRTGNVEQITQNAPMGAPVDSLIGCTPVFFPAHDGLQIPALLYRPAGDGPFPMVMVIHGGPEWQEVPAYRPFYQTLLANGIGVVAPNVRGSTGYGKTYQRKIYRDWGGDDLRDFESVHRGVTQLDWVDDSRVAVFGGSYGGFATLSCVTRLPELWACAIDLVGPSNLITFVNSVPEEWKPIMKGWVGDAVEDAELLRERSPITYIDQIRCPLFVVQGAHDPRVVKAESDQIVESLRARGVDVRYDVYEDEGHGFTRRENNIKFYTDAVEYLRGHLLEA